MDFNKLHKIIFATNPSYVGGGGLLFFVFQCFDFPFSLEVPFLKNIPISKVVWSGVVLCFQNLGT